jgi:hypothetical protein
MVHHILIVNAYLVGMQLSGKDNMKINLLLLCALLFLASGLGVCGENVLQKDRPRNYPSYARYYPSQKTVEVGISQSAFTTGDGQSGLTARYYRGENPEGEPTAVRVEAFPRLDRAFIAKHIGDPPYVISWQGRFGPAPRNGLYELSIVRDNGVRAWVNGQSIIRGWGGWPAELHTGRVRIERGETVDFRLDFLCKNKAAMLEVHWGLVQTEENPDAGGKDDVARRTGRFRVVNPENGTLLQRRFEYSRTGDRVSLDVGDLPDGRYICCVDVGAKTGEVRFPFVREHFVWEGNRLGITDEVLPPFEPIDVRDDVVGVVLRDYEVGDLGLWDSVRVRGNETGHRELLAAPMRLMVDGEPLKAAGRFTSTADHEVVYEGTGQHPAVTVESRTTTQYDGCMRVALTLRPGQSGKELRDMTVEIPLKDALVPLWHVVSMGIRVNPAGYTPEGEGRIWESQGQYRSRPHRNRYRRGNWEPYVWLGAEERGLCWFADNDGGWIPDTDNNDPSLTLHRNDGVLTLGVHLVQKPVMIEEPRTIVFGLMASPAKPMPANWRNIMLGNMWSYAGQEPGYRTFDWMGSQYWGSRETFAAKYPVGRDFSVIDKMQEARLTRRAGVEPFLKAWSRGKFTTNETEPQEEAVSVRPRSYSEELYDLRVGRTKSPEKIKSLLGVALRWARRLPGDMSVYWEECVRVSFTHPETKTFGWEWTGGQSWSPNFTRSYQDFACWYGAEFLRRGVGLYFDNTFPEPAVDPRTSTAYRLERVEPGRGTSVQCSAGMWSRREYFRRIWTLHRQLPPDGMNPRMVLHMTNTHVLPYMVWNDSNLDLEWRDHVLPRQKAFRPDMLRVQSLGLQTGTIPQALAFKKARDDVSFFGSMMVHEIRSWFTNDRAREMLEHMLEFGYGRSDCRVINYWDAEPPLRISDGECKWLLMQRGGELLVLLCTWNPESQRLQIQVDTKDLGVDLQRAMNVEDGSKTKISGGEFEFQMPGYGTRLIRLGADEL